MRQGLTMADEAKPPTLDYATTPVRRRKIARIYYCSGLPLIGFALGYGWARYDQMGTSVMLAVGAFLVALALPVRD